MIGRCIAVLLAPLTLAGNVRAQAVNCYLPASIGVGKGVLSDVELERYRGGFVVADGLTLGFAAVTRTLVDGSLALETHLSWDDDGVKVQQVAGPGVVSQSPAALPASTLSSLSAAGINPAQLNSIYSTADGQSQIIQRVGSDFLTNTILNGASNRAISQDTSITLTLPGFQATQAGLSAAARATALANDLANGAMLGLRR